MPSRRELAPIGGTQGRSALVEVLASTANMRRAFCVPIVNPAAVHVLGGFTTGSALVIGQSDCREDDRGRSPVAAKLGVVGAEPVGAP